MSAHECDRHFRMRKTTAATAARAGLVRHVIRRAGGRYGRVILINAADANRLWGAK